MNDNSDDIFIDDDPFENLESRLEGALNTGEPLASGQPPDPQEPHDAEIRLVMERIKTRTQARRASDSAPSQTAGTDSDDAFHPLESKTEPARREMPPALDEVQQSVTDDSAAIDVEVSSLNIFEPDDWDDDEPDLSDDLGPLGFLDESPTPSPAMIPTDNGSAMWPSFIGERDDDLDALVPPSNAPPVPPPPPPDEFDRPGHVSRPQPTRNESAEVGVAESVSVFGSIIAGVSATDDSFTKPTPSPGPTSIGTEVPAWLPASDTPTSLPASGVTATASVVDLGRTLGQRGAMAPQRTNRGSVSAAPPPRTPPVAGRAPLVAERNFMTGTYAGETTDMGRSVTRLTAPPPQAEPPKSSRGILYTVGGITLIVLSVLVYANYYAGKNDATPSENMAPAVAQTATEGDDAGTTTSTDTESPIVEVTRCSAEGANVTVTSTSPTPKVVNLRFQFLKDGEIYYEEQSATPKVTAGEPLTNSLLLIGKDIPAEYEGVEPDECKVDIVSVTDA